MQLQVLGFFSFIVCNQFLDSLLRLSVLLLIVTHPILHHLVAAHHAVFLPAPAVSAG